MSWPATTSSSSPIEDLFWDVVQALHPPHLDGLVRQHPVFDGTYVLDFALPEYRLGIELDGFEYHGSREAFLNDRRRDRNLSTARWVVIHFAGSEINDHPRQCVQQANAWAGVWRRLRS